MKILAVHCAYQQRGGEEVSFETETAALRRHGAQVVEYLDSNDRVSEYSQLGLGFNTIWSGESYRRLLRLVRQEQHDVAYFNNTFPLISPSAYYACASAGIPVVQALRNYRLFCPPSTFLRDGSICEDCVGHLFCWPAVRHACYRDSRTATLAAALMLGFHRLLGTYRRKVTLYMALTEFGRRKVVAAGLPEDKVVVRPNCVDPDPGQGHHRGGYALFVGRLSPEKGLDTIMQAWPRKQRPLPLRIVGAGPMQDKVERWTGTSPGVTYLGPKTHEEVLRLMKDALVLLFPSTWYEGIGRVILEAYATGLPVLGSRLGAMEEVIEDGVTGRHFEAGSPEDLAAKLDWAAGNGEALSRMGETARQEYLAKYTGDRCATRTLEIFRQAVSLGPAPKRLGGGPR